MFSCTRDLVSHPAVLTLESGVTMNEILELASTLGKRIADDPRAKQMAEARAAFDNNPEAKQLLADYNQAQQDVHELETQGKPIEPEHKRKLADLHAKVIDSDMVKTLMKAQMDYAALMSAVSQRIDSEALGTTVPSQA